MCFYASGISIEITFLFVAFIAFLISLRAPANVFFTVISSLFHEMGHLFVMMLLSCKPQKIRFELTGINIIRRNIPLNTFREILISLGGPVFNGILFVFSCFILCLFKNNSVMTFACTNLILMLFNMMPVKGLDGGNILYNLLIRLISWEKAVIISKTVSIAFIILIYLWGFYAFCVTGFNFSLIIIAIFLTLSLISDKEC